MSKMTLRSKKESYQLSKYFILWYIFALLNSFSSVRRHRALCWVFRSIRIWRFIFAGKMLRAWLEPESLKVQTETLTNIGHRFTAWGKDFAHYISTLANTFQSMCHMSGKLVNQCAKMFSLIDFSFFGKIWSCMLLSDFFSYNWFVLCPEAWAQS